MTSIDSEGYVTFSFYRPGVSQVNVLGTFNRWSGDSLRMQQVGNGWWSVTAELPAGEYRFRYCADGEWYSDYASHGVENGRHGWNSVLIVPQPVASAMRMESEEMRQAA